VSRFRFVCDFRHEYPVKRLCRLCEVSTSGFYAWLKRPPSERALADRALLAEIEQIHRESRCTANWAAAASAWAASASPG